MIQWSAPHQENDIGVLQCQGAGRHRQQMFVRHHPLAHRRTQARTLTVAASSPSIIDWLDHQLENDPSPARPELVQCSLREGGGIKI
jgi:hypothetical protein